MMPIVIDAAALAEVVGRTDRAPAVEAAFAGEDLVTPDLLNAEVLSAPFIAEMWSLRHDVTPYDAAYVVLARRTGCALLTLDERLRRAQGSASGYDPGSCSGKVRVSATTAPPSMRIRTRCPLRSRRSPLTSNALAVNAGSEPSSSSTVPLRVSGENVAQVACTSRHRPTVSGATSRTSCGATESTIVAAAATARLIAEATGKAGVVWIAVGSGRPRPAWHQWREDAAYVVTGGVEQPLPGLADAALAAITVAGKQTGGRVLTWAAHVTRVQPGSEEWERVVPGLHTARLNALATTELPGRWAREATVLRLKPTGTLLEGPGALPDGAGAAPPAPTPATTAGPRPYMLGRRRTLEP